MRPLPPMRRLAKPLPPNVSRLSVLLMQWPKQLPKWLPKRQQLKLQRLKLQLEAAQAPAKEAPAARESELQQAAAGLRQQLAEALSQPVAQV